MRRFGRKNARRREMIAMVLTSVLVLGALTVTGVYIKNRNETENQDGYYIDFDSLEAEMSDKLNQTADAGDLDYTGESEEFDYTNQNSEAVQSGSIEKEDTLEEADQKTADAEMTDTQSQEAEVPVVEVTPTDNQVVQSSVETSVTEQSTETGSNSVVANIPTLSFSKDDSLVWPIVGNVIINYSMDKSVYFATLDQFKYSSGMVISAKEGEQVTAATDAVISRIYEDNELGTVVEMNLGDGYCLSYGQMHNVSVTEGQYVTTGQLVGQAGKPTKYYSVEGTNVYLRLTKDGESVDPMTFME